MRKTSFSILLVALAILFWCASTHASEYGVQELGTSEIRDDSSFQQKENNVEVLTTKDWEGQNFSLAEILSRHSGIQSYRQGGTGSFQTVSIRGVAGKNILICIDGIPQNEMNGGAFDLGSIDLNLIEKIEIYKNRIPAKFGTGKLGGAINFITKKSIQPSGKVIASYGSHNFWEGSAQISGSPKDSFFVSANLGVRHSDNDYEFTNRNGTPYDKTDDFTDKRENADYSEISGSVQIRKLHKNDFFSVLSLYGFHAIGGNPGREDHQTKIASFSGDFFQWNYTLETPKVLNSLWISPSLSGKISKNMGDTYYPLDHIGFLSSEYLEYGMFYFNLCPGLYLEWNPTKKFETEVLVNGAYDFGEARGDSKDWSLERFSITSSVDATYKFTEWLKIGINFGTLISQDNLNKGSFVLPTGTRILKDNQETHYSFTGSSFLSIVPKNFPISSEISFGRFFRQPELLELYGVYPGSISNPDLKEETAWRFETALRYSVTKRTFLKGAYFETLTENGIYWINSGAFMKPENIGEAYIQGFELSLESMPVKFLEITLNGTIQKTEDISTAKAYNGKQLPLEPSGSYFAQIGLLFSPITFRFSSSYRTAIYGDRAEKLKQPSVSHYNASVTYDFEKSSLIFSVDNISNETYRNIYTPFPMPGREYRLTFIQNF